MKEYICRGTLTLDGVHFYVQAESEEEAAEKAERGNYHSYDISCASTTNCELDASTLEANE